MITHSLAIICLLVSAAWCVQPLQSIELPRPHPLDPPGHRNQTIWDILSDNPDLSCMKVAVEKAGFMQLLDGLEPSITLFAASNGAFHRLDSDVKDYLKDNLEVLSGVALYHMVPGIFSSSNLKDQMDLTSLAGIPLHLFVRQLLENTSIVAVNQATIVSKDLYAANGVIHIIEEVLLPDRFALNISSDETKNMSLSKVLSKHHYLSTFYQALNRSNMLGLLDDHDSIFTVFAPLNPAWNGAYVKLLDNNHQAKLVDVLKYHIIKGEVDYSTDVHDKSSLKTVQGQKLLTRRSTFLPKELDRMFVDNAEIVKSNIVGKNGVIHFINKVLLPEATSRSNV